MNMVIGMLWIGPNGFGTMLLAMTFWLLLFYMFIVLFNNFENIVSGEVSAKKFIVIFGLIAAFFCWMVSKAQDSGYGRGSCDNEYCWQHSPSKKQVNGEWITMRATRDQIGKFVTCPQCGTVKLVTEDWWVSGGIYSVGHDGENNGRD